MNRALWTAAVAALVVASACDDGQDTGQGGAASSSTAATTSTSSTGGAGGSPPDDNDTIETATELHVKLDGTMYGQGLLDPPDTDVDFWSFEGTPGPVLVLVRAKPPTDGFSPSDVDTVLSLYDPGGELIAGNDDGFPRVTQDSQLYTVLPGQGVYFLKVEEYCKTVVDFNATHPQEPSLDPGCNEQYFDALTGLDYSIFVVPLDPKTPGDGVVEEVEPNDSTTGATPLEYEPKPEYTGYFATIVLGELAGDSDVDHFFVEVPVDVVPQPGTRRMIGFDVQPAGPGAPSAEELPGNGSSRQVGRVELLDTEEQVLARVDFAGRLPNPNPWTWPQLLVPLPDASSQYSLRVQPGEQTAGVLGPFYFVIQSFGGGSADGPNPVETAEATNDSFSTPEYLLVASGKQSSFIDGDLPDGDVDHFELAVTNEAFAVVCAAQGVGSGVRDLTVAVLGGSDGQILKPSPLLGTGLEVSIAVLPFGETRVVARIEKGSQDPEVLGVYYRCGFHFGTVADFYPPE